MEEQKDNKNLIILILVFIIGVLVGIIGFIVYQKTVNTENESNNYIDNKSNNGIVEDNNDNNSNNSVGDSNLINNTVIETVDLPKEEKKNVKYLIGAYDVVGDNEQDREIILYDDGRFVIYSVYEKKGEVYIYTGKYKEDKDMISFPLDYRYEKNKCNKLSEKMTDAIYKPDSGGLYTSIEGSFPYRETTKEKMKHLDVMLNVDCK